jgi:hypothetical protein
MTAVDGKWDVVVRTPLGDQKAVLAVQSTGSEFTGSLSGALGAVEIPEGKVDGNTLSWVMSITTPMSMTLECSATIEGDALTGSVGAGMLGSFPLSGTRKA